MDGGNWLCETARRQSKLSLRALATRAGTSHATLSAYENGRVDPTTKVLSRIIGATGYSLEATLLGIPSDIEGMSRGKELIAVLELAEQFPARHASELEFPLFSTDMTSIVDKILAISAALENQRFPYGFGGALALAFCTERARGTIDIDVKRLRRPGQGQQSAEFTVSACELYRGRPGGPRAGRPGPACGGNRRPSTSSWTRLISTSRRHSVVNSHDFWWPADSISWLFRPGRLQSLLQQDEGLG